MLSFFSFVGIATTIVGAGVGAYYGIKWLRNNIVVTYCPQSQRTQETETNEESVG